jgi:hypothetical protein
MHIPDCKNWREDKILKCRNWREDEIIDCRNWTNILSLPRTPTRTCCPLQILDQLTAELDPRKLYLRLSLISWNNDLIPC